MTDLRKAAEMALEALDALDRRGGLGLDVHDYLRTKTKALRQALAQPEWVGLTDADKQEAFDETQEAGGGFWEFADYLDAKLREKNGG